MNIVRHRVFLRNFQKRVFPNRDLVRRFEERMGLFIVDTHNPILRDHQLVGEKRNLRAFSVTGDIRVVYKIERDDIVLLDIGNHNQVY